MHDFGKVLSALSCCAVFVSLKSLPLRQIGLKVQDANSLYVENIFLCVQRETGFPLKSNTKTTSGTISFAHTLIFSSNSAALRIVKIETDTNYEEYGI